MTPKQFQSALTNAGFAPGPIDGKWGPSTQAAVQAWFRSGRDLDQPSAEQHVSERGIKDLVHSEGVRTNAYKDSVGVWTIGVGHAATSGRPPVPRSGMVITEAEAYQILTDDLREQYEPDVRAAFGREVPQHVFDGAVSFHFNTGKIKTASWVKTWLAGNMAKAREQFMLYKKPPEIIGRRTREANLIFNGVYAS